MLKAIGYIRVSDREQGKDERFSLPHQREHIEEYCRQKNWQLIQIYDDVESGKGTTRRRGLKTALVALNEADLLIVHELDRLSRNLMDTLLIVNDVAHMKKLFVSIHDNIDSSTDEKWELQFHILAVFAHYFRKQLSRKVHETMLTKAQRGEWNSKPPFGYILENKHLVVNENESWIIRRIFDLYINHHYGIRAITIDLNRDTKARNGGPWDYAEVKRILKNHAYIGDSIWNTRKRNETKDIIRPEEEWVIVKDTHGAIIEREVFEAVQERLKIRAQYRGTARSRVYLLSGLLHCGYCDSKMHGANRKSHFSKTKGRALDHFKYVCTAYHKKGTCQGLRVDSAEIEENVLNYIKAFIGPKKEIKKLFKADFNPKIIADKKRKLDSMKKSLEAIPDKLDLQLQSFENKRITEKEFERGRARVLAEETELTKQIESLSGELKEIKEEDIHRHSMADFYDIFPSADILVQKEWLQRHIQKIVVRPDDIKVTLMGT
jgi:DNA invertase Pin-like site-specific DNA recombinase